MGDGPIGVLVHTGTGNTQIWTDWFPVAPTMAYEFRLKWAKPDALNRFYFGLNVANETLTGQAVDHINSANGGISTTSTNFYFISGTYSDGGDAVGYLLPLGADPSSVQNTGRGVTYHARFAATDTRFARLRWLNWDNGDTEVPAWVGNVSVRAVSVEDIVRAKQRSEERRVGKECRSRWSPYH